MSTKDKPRMGRPPGSKFPHVVHLRIGDAMRNEIEEYAAKRINMPDMASVMRELIAVGLDASRDDKRRK